jgi:chromosome segregation ATPase
MKTKKEILDERLDRIKKNSEKLIMRMDQKIETINSLKEDLNKKSYQIDKWENDYRDVLRIMAERMLGVKIIKNPL